MVGKVIAQIIKCYQNKEQSPEFFIVYNEIASFSLFDLCLTCTQHENENKRPMGHIAHLKKQFKSINTYNYIITLIDIGKKTL